MRIACLAFGSLVWKWGELPLLTPWQRGGPRLPIEFSRGDHHELGTALCAGAGLVPTRWAELLCGDLAEARERLREREGVAPERMHGIGSVCDLQSGATSTLSPRPTPVGEAIGAWGRTMRLDAVVWTALPPRFAGQEGRAPDADEAIAYLRSLRGEPLRHARDYIERVPPEVRTSLRQRIEQALGWRPVEPRREPNDA